MSSSGCHTSARPPPKPNVLPPIDSIATLPVRMNKSAQEILLPYFCLIGHSNRRALSRLPLSGQLLRGAKRCVPVPATSTAVTCTICTCGVPSHTDKEWTIMSVVSRPPILTVCHEIAKILLKRLVV